jgi:hypothetical protein
MSKNDPTRPKHKKDAGTAAPDVIVVYDGTRPPTQDNIKRVYEIKFGDDRLATEKRGAYTRIAGAAAFEVLTPKNCGCEKEEAERLPEPISAKEAAMLDGVPGDELILAPPLAKQLLRIAPLLTRLLAKLRPVYPPPMSPPL